MGSSSSDMDMDTLLANAGYSVRVSELAHVAQRLEQLESVVSNYSSPDDHAALSSHLLSTTTESVNHCNPSDMAAWIECMIQELGPSVEQQEDDDEEEEEEEEEEDEEANEGSRSSHGRLIPNNTSNTTTITTSATNTNNGLSSNHPKVAINCHDSSAGPPVFNMAGYIGKDLLCPGMLLLDEISSDLEATYHHKSLTEDQTSSSSSSSSSSKAATATTTFSATTTTTNHGDGAFNAIAFLNPSAIGLDQESMLPSTGFHVPQHQDQVCATASMPSSHCSYGSPPYESFPNPQPLMMAEEGMDTTDILNANPSISSSPNPMIPCYETTIGMDAGGSVLNPKVSSHGTPHLEHHHHHNHNHNHNQHEHAAAQESGIRLIHLLMACAECVQNNEFTLALAVAREITGLAALQHGAIGKVANFFVDALARRACGVNTPEWSVLLSHADSFSEMLYFHFYEICPYLKFAHFTANQAILEAFQGHKFVHVIDFNLMQGLQWPALIQALALRPGGPPHLRITGIGLPQVDNKDVLREIGMKLARLASSVNVEFSFRGVIATKLNDVKPTMLEVKEGEAVAVNSILQLHRLLNGETSTGGNSGSNSSNGVSNNIAPIDEVLQSIKAFNPKVVTIVEQEARHNDPRFLNRFVEALHYYCTMFDSLEACGLPPQCRELAYTEEYLGREIMNIVACEGVMRVERHEPLEAWRQRMLNSGFRPSHLGSDAFKQASMLLTLFSGEGYTVEENNGCLTLGWHSRPLIAASAWQCG